MSSTISDVVRGLIHAHRHSSVALAADAVATLLLLTLLVEVELLRAYDASRVRAGMRVLAVGIAPLLVSFVLIVVVRALNLR